MAANMPTTSKKEIGAARPVPATVLPLPVLLGHASNASSSPSKLRSSGVNAAGLSRPCEESACFRPEGCCGPDAPVRHSAKRRRIKTVLQELIYRAGRLIETGRKLILGLGASDRAAKVFGQMHLALAGAT